MYPPFGKRCDCLQSDVGAQKSVAENGHDSQASVRPEHRFLRQAKKVAENKGIIALYPEGKITCDGRRGEMSPAVAKLLKLLALPVVVCCIKGCYLFRPKWAYKKRKSGGVEVHINPLFSTEEMKTLSVEEIFDKVLKAFEHDEFEWQKAKRYKDYRAFQGGGA